MATKRLINTYEIGQFELIKFLLIRNFRIWNVSLKQFKDFTFVYRPLCSRCRYVVRGDNNVIDDDDWSWKMRIVCSCYFLASLLLVKECIINGHKDPSADEIPIKSEGEFLHIRDHEADREAGMTKKSSTLRGTWTGRRWRLIIIISSIRQYIVRWIRVSDFFSVVAVSAEVCFDTQPGYWLRGWHWRRRLGLNR